jgi:hypothetical protein
MPAGVMIWTDRRLGKTISMRHNGSMSVASPAKAAVLPYAVKHNASIAIIENTGSQARLRESVLSALAQLGLTNS